MNPTSSLFPFKDHPRISKHSNSPLPKPLFQFAISKSQKKDPSSAFELTPNKPIFQDFSKTSQKPLTRRESNSPPLLNSTHSNSKSNFQFPISSKQFLLTFSGHLSSNDQKELKDYEEVYYFNEKVQVSLSENLHDSEDGDYIIRTHDHLAYRYEILEVLGKGTFGQVVKCLDHKRKEEVAVKVIKNKKRFYRQALIELKILQKLRQNDRENNYNVVRIKNYFMFRKHVCITFELLSLNLFELIMQNNYEGLSLTLTHRFAVQILVCLQYIRKYGIVHCDLKPENILLRSPNKPMISVIDFGSACYETEPKSFYVQSRFYRAPEVLLGYKYDYAIDMWSFGCIMAELFTGSPLFPGESEHHQLLLITSLIGPPPLTLLKKSSKLENFFDSNFDPKPYTTRKGQEFHPEPKNLANTLDCSNSLFIDFINKCLTWDPDSRIKPLEGLEHPWVAEGLKRKGS